MGQEINARHSLADDPNIVSRVKNFVPDDTAGRFIHEYMEANRSGHRHSGVDRTVGDASFADLFGLNIALESGKSSKDMGADALAELQKGPPPDSALKEGDIIFQADSGGQGLAIQLATKSPLTHCGVLFKEDGKWMVYEAVQPVKVTPLETFAINGDDGSYVVRRLKDADKALTDEALDKMRDYLKSNIGKNYDALFGWGDDRIYCSELVWKAYHEATGLDVGTPKKMGDYDMTNPEVLRQVEERWGLKLPLDELMITPAGVYESNLLETVR